MIRAKTKAKASKLALYSYLPQLCTIYEISLPEFALITLAQRTQNSQIPRDFLMVVTDLKQLLCKTESIAIVFTEQQIKTQTQ